MTDYEPPEIDIQELMASIRDSLSKRNVNERTVPRLFPTRPSNSLTHVIDPPDLKLSPDFQLKADNRYHVNDLLKYHDREFVRNAYRAILKREPDESGYKGFLVPLRTGTHNKIDVLASLRFSSEGMQKNVRLDGLKFARQIRRLGRLPVLGYVVQLIVAVLRLPSSIQDRRRFESYALNQQREIAGHINLLAATIRTLNNFANELPGKIDDQYQRLSALMDQQQTALLAQQQEELKTVSDKLHETLGQHENKLSSHEAGLAIQAQTLVDVSQELSQRLFQEGSSREALAEALNAQLGDSRKSLQEQSREVEQLAQILKQVKTELVVQQARTSSLIDSVRATNGKPTQDVFREEDAHLLDALYVSLEDRFRGERSEVKENFKTYLPYLKEAGITSAILDIGCGRGEWLELLQEEGIEAKGIDNNRSMIDKCEASGLQVVCANAIDYLRSLADESIGAVTSFHLIEHLEFDILLKMIEEIIRTLKPGGLLILETPNPENALVGSCNFYLDPTHRKPLPSELMQFLLEARGFVDVEVITLHPLLAGRIAGDTELTQRFNDIFYGPMDYAILARKIHPPSPGIL
jgi:SAM-dependent methyltransferase